MLQSLRIFPILQGIRGQAGVDLPALAAALVNLSRLAVDYPEIRELDLNPVVAAPQGCCASTAGFYDESGGVGGGVGTRLLPLTAICPKPLCRC